MALPPTSNAIVVPRSAVPFILLQRPMLQRLQVRARQLRLPFRLRLAMEARLRRGEVTRRFVGQMEAEFRDLRPALPAAVRDIVDIGCGVAAVDALLFRHYGRPAALAFHLLDRTALPLEPAYGFAPRDEFYNSLPAARALLVANGVPEACVSTIEVGTATPAALPAADLIVSLASWGFHYPVTTYLEQASAALRPGGAIILDVRRGTDGVATLERRFARVEPVAEIFAGNATRYRVSGPAERAPGAAGNAPPARA